jgi:hypothetical protein
MIERFTEDLVRPIILIEGRLVRPPLHAAIELLPIMHSRSGGPFFGEDWVNAVRAGSEIRVNGCSLGHFRQFRVRLRQSGRDIFELTEPIAR